MRLTRWKTPQDIKGRYASASILEGNRVVFNIKGNDYRLVTAVAYRFQAVPAYAGMTGVCGDYRPSTHPPIPVRRPGAAPRKRA